MQLLTPRFVPTQLSNLRNWYEPDPTVWFQSSGGSGAVGSDGDPLGYWGDKSGNARHLTQSTSGARPSVYFDALNGYPVVRFAGSHWLTTSTWSAESQPLTAFAVARCTDNTAQRQIFDGHTTGGSRITLFYQTSNRLTLYAGTAVNYTVGDVSAFALVAAMFNTTSSVLSVDRICTNGAGGGNTFSGMHVGSNHNGNNEFLIGDIAEILVYGRLLTYAEIAMVENYLIQKYGLAQSYASGVVVATNATYSSSIES